MEELGRGRGVDHVHVDTVSVRPRLLTVCQLQKPLQSAGRMLRTHPIQSVGEEQHQTAL